MVGLLLLFIWFPEATSTGAYNYNDLLGLYLIPMYMALAASLYSGFNYYKGSFKEIVNG
jgi:hypothetical protein